MDGEALDPDSFKAIARLPGRDALNAQLAGVVASPLTGLVRGLGSMIQGLALQLGQIAEQGLVSGEPPKEDASYDGEAEEHRRREEAPEAAPEPTESPEETSEEEAPEGEDAGQSEPAETGEGDQDIGEEPAAEESAGGTEEAGGDDDSGGDEQTSEDSDENKEDSE